MSIRIKPPISWINQGVRKLTKNSTTKDHQKNKFAKQTSGWVGLLPLPRNAKDTEGGYGVSWKGLPTFQQQKGNYPFVAEHLDLVKAWVHGDFKTKRVFFEHYWGTTPSMDDPDPAKNALIKKIRQAGAQGRSVEHILICREWRLLRKKQPQAKPGPFEEDT